MLNTYTHLGLEDVAEELKQMEGWADASKRQQKVKGENLVSQEMFRAIELGKYSMHSALRSALCLYVFFVEYLKKLDEQGIIKADKFTI